MKSIALFFLICVQSTFSQKIGEDLETMFKRDAIKSIKLTNFELLDGGTKGKPTSIKITSFNSAGNVTDKTEFWGDESFFQKDVYIYNAQGFLITEKHFDDESGKYSYKTEYINDLSGKPTTVINFNEKNQIQNTTTYKRDDNGLVLYEFYDDKSNKSWNKRHSCYNEKGTETERVDSLFYDKKLDVSKNIVIPKYDEKGLLIQEDVFYKVVKEKPDSINFYEYDREGNLVLFHVFDISGEEYHRVTKWYDSGMLQSYASGRNYNNLEIKEYQYLQLDDRGNWTERQLYKNGKVDNWEIREIQYYK